MATCRDFRTWFQTAEPGEPEPQEVRRHREDCPECRGLEKAYRQAVAHLHRTVTRPSQARPDMDAIRAALRGEAWTRIRGWAWAIPVATALVWFLWPAGHEPEGPDLQEMRRAAAPAPAREDAERVVVTSGQVIQTEDSAVMLSDARIGTLRLSPRTRLRVGAWGSGSTILFLDQGEIEASVVHREPDQAFEVHTAYATVRSIGTRFWVSHRPEAGTTVICLEGRVAVVESTGREVARLDAGRSLTVDARGVPAGGPDLALSALPVSPAEARNRAVVPLSRTPRVAPAIPPPGEPEPSGSGAAPPALEEVLAHARDLVARDRGEEAVEYLTSLPEASLSRHARVLALLGDVLQTLGRHDEARNAYESALGSSSSAQAEGILADLAGLYLDRLEDPTGAERVWRRYLDTYPEGRYRFQALFELADLARSAGRPDDARALLRRLLEEGPGSPLAVRALVQVGRDLVESGRLDEAADWFEAYAGRGAGDLAEAAIVGLMRVRSQQGRVEEVRALAGEHGRRFPEGRRGDEVKTLLERTRADAR